MCNGSDYIGYDFDPAQTSIALCKIKFYLSAITAQLPPTFVVLACIDRLMLSSLNVNIRLWSQPRFAYRWIAVVSIFWTIFSVHALFGSNIYHRMSGSFCTVQPGSYTLFLAIYSIICLYLLPPILMGILGVLTILNVRRVQRRIFPRTNRGRMQRKDRHLLRMLLFQVLVNIIFTVPRGVFQVLTIAEVRHRSMKSFLSFTDICRDLSQLAEGCSMANVGFIFSSFGIDVILYSILC